MPDCKKCSAAKAKAILSVAGPVLRAAVDFADARARCAGHGYADGTWAEAREAESRLINELGKRPRLAEAIRRSGKCPGSAEKG